MRTTLAIIVMLFVLSSCSKRLESSVDRCAAQVAEANHEVEESVRSQWRVVFPKEAVVPDIEAKYVSGRKRSKPDDWSAIITVGTQCTRLIELSRGGPDAPIKVTADMILPPEKDAARLAHKSCLSMPIEKWPWPHPQEVDFANVSFVYTRLGRTIFVTNPGGHYWNFRLSSSGGIILEESTYSGR